MNTFISRRDFLKGSITGAGLTLAVGCTPMGLKLFNVSTDQANLDATFKPSAFLEIQPDSKVTVWVGQTELGQGAHTALPMIVAEELEADWKTIRVRQAPAADEFKDPIWQMQITGGSTSVRHRFDQLRKAGAAAREMLKQAAANTWGVSVDDCIAVDGTVKQIKNHNLLTFGELSSKAAKLPVPQEPPLKKPDQFKIIGTSRARLDIPAKVNASAVFGIDFSVPDMCVALVSHPPGYGMKPFSYNMIDAKAIRGVKDVVALDSGIAVCADTAYAAFMGMETLKIQWHEGSHPNLNDQSLERLFAGELTKPGAVARNDGDVARAFDSTAKHRESSFYLPYLAHATMEPMNCTAHISSDACRIWVPTQFQTAVQEVGAKISGLPPEKVEVKTTYCGGGFGRRGEVGVVIEALQLSKRFKQPVKVIWAREEDFKNDFYRPGSMCQIKGALDKNGNLVAWHHKIAVSSIMSRVFPQMVKDGIDAAAVEGIVDMDYQIPNIKVEYIMMELPIPVGFWRSVGNTHNTFAVESFMDDLAHLANKDPLEFRIKLLGKNQRARRVLELVAEKSGWGKPIQKGNGRGLALRTCFGSTVAQYAEVSVEEKSGKIKVHRIICAVDCGTAVNPDNIVAQMEGGIIFGLSSALKEEIHFSKGGVSTSNYDDYAILKMSETPEIEIHIMQSGEKIGGIGELGVPPVAPAVANAVFDASGFRLRRLPMTPENIKAG